MNKPVELYNRYHAAYVNELEKIAASGGGIVAKILSPYRLAPSNQKLSKLKKILKRGIDSSNKRTLKGRQDLHNSVTFSPKRTDLSMYLDS